MCSFSGNHECVLLLNGFEASSLTSIISLYKCVQKIEYLPEHKKIMIFKNVHTLKLRSTHLKKSSCILKVFGNFNKVFHELKSEKMVNEKGKKIERRKTRNEKKASYGKMLPVNILRVYDTYILRPSTAVVTIAHSKWKCL